MSKRKELKDKYKNGNDFIADVSKRTMIILKELEAVLDEEKDDLFDDISVSDYFTIMSLRDKLNELVEEND
jgi:hypothetical protein